MKVFLDSVGCRLNQSELERMAGQFQRLGHTLVPTAAQSDLVVINTCTVTAAAAADSRSKTRRAHRSNPEAKIVLTGCYNTVSSGEARTLPGVVRLIDNDEKDHLVNLVTDVPPETDDPEPAVRAPVPGDRMRTRAFIKVQDGCDNRCTYCLTTIARGPARSIPLEKVISEIQSVCSTGVQEAVLTGVQLSAYGKGLSDGANIKTLVQAILHYTDIPRLRLSSLEPWNLPGEFFKLWDDPRLCRQLHLPLQSGSKTILKLMGRPMTPDDFTRIACASRKAIPDLALTSDIMVGFPGESETDFQESLDFIQSIGFAHAHVFTYSPRPETPASRLPEPVHPSLAKKRSQIVREVVSQSARVYQNGFIGRKLQALWETSRQLGPDTWQVSGLTDNYLRVHSRVDRDLWNQITTLRITQFDGEKLWAVPILS